MTRLLLEASKGGMVEIHPDGATNRFYSLLASAPPNSVHLLHVFWSGEAFFFSQDLGAQPTPEEMTDTLEPGSVTWFPQLKELIIAYGIAAPRDPHGEITVARVGRVEDVAAIREIGHRIWLHGSEDARLRVAQE